MQIDIPATPSQVGYLMIPSSRGRPLSPRPVICSGGLGNQHPHCGLMAAMWMDGATGSQLDPPAAVAAPFCLFDSRLRFVIYGYIARTSVGNTNTPLRLVCPTSRGRANQQHQRSLSPPPFRASHLHGGQAT